MKRAALLFVCALAVWVCDSLIRGSLVRPALRDAGFGETVTARNPVPRRCGILDYEAVFWGNGRATGEEQGYVCIGYFHAPEIHRIPFDEELGTDLFSEI